MGLTYFANSASRTRLATRQEISPEYLLAIGLHLDTHKIAITVVC